MKSIDPVYYRVAAVCVGLFLAGLTAVGVTALREQKQVARWPQTEGTMVLNEGGPVNVHFNPTYPAESYLLVGDPESSRAAVGIGLIVIVAGIVWWWVVGRSMKALRERAEQPEGSPGG